MGVSFQKSSMFYFDIIETDLFTELGTHQNKHCSRLVGKVYGLADFSRTSTCKQSHVPNEMMKEARFVVDFQSLVFCRVFISSLTVMHKSLHLCILSASWNYTARESQFCKSHLLSCWFLCSDFLLFAFNTLWVVCNFTASALCFLSLSANPFLGLILSPTVSNEVFIITSLEGCFVFNHKLFIVRN